MVLAPASALAAGVQGASRHTAAPATANWQVPLVTSLAYPSTTSSMQYQAQPGQREFQIEMHRFVSLRGASLLVQVNGAAVGSMKVKSNGIAQFGQNTELGQPVPPIMHGSTVTVTTPTGQVIAAGRF